MVTFLYSIFSICFIHIYIKHTILLIKRSKKLNSIKKFNKIWLFQFFWSLLISFFVLFTLRFLICFVLDITYFFGPFTTLHPQTYSWLRHWCLNVCLGVGWGCMWVCAGVGVGVFVSFVIYGHSNIYALNCFYVFFPFKWVLVSFWLEGIANN